MASRLYTMVMCCVFGVKTGGEDFEADLVSISKPDFAEPYCKSDDVVQNVGNTVQFPRCDVTIENSLCLKDGSYVLLPPARPLGLLARYTFDEAFVLDSSANRNHGQGELFPGPSAMGGTGASALFRKSYIMLRDVHTGKDEYSYLFWLYILKDATSVNSSGPDWCPGEF